MNHISTLSRQHCCLFLLCTSLILALVSVGLSAFFLRAPLNINDTTIPNMTYNSPAKASNDLLFEQSEVKSAKQLGESLYLTDAKGKYLSIYLSITNRSEEAQTLDPLQFALVNNKGETYGLSGEGQSGRNMLDNSVSFYNTVVDPGETVTGQVTFDVLNLDEPYQLLFRGQTVMTDIRMETLYNKKQK